MKPLPKPEDPAAVQAALTAVLERPAAPRRVHAWACARCGDDRKTETPPPSPRFCPRCAARILEMHTEPAAKIDTPKPGPAYKCETCGKGFTSASALGGHRNTHTSAKAKRKAVEAAPAPFPYRPGSVADRAEKDDPKAIAELAREEFAALAPDRSMIVVRVRGAVPLEVERATPEDAAAFVRLVSAGGVS